MSDPFPVADDGGRTVTLTADGKVDGRDVRWLHKPDTHKYEISKISAVASDAIGAPITLDSGLSFANPVKFRVRRAPTLETAPVLDCPSCHHSLVDVASGSPSTRGRVCVPSAFSTCTRLHEFAYATGCLHVLAVNQRERELLELLKYARERLGAVDRQLAKTKGSSFMLLLKQCAWGAG